MPSHFLREVEHFISTYKQLEGVTVKTGGWTGHDTAIDEAKSSIDRFRLSSST